jgi:hypothetical protein
MSEIVELSPAERVTERPFTDAAHNDQDLVVMRRILGSLSLLVGQPLEWPEPPHALVVRSDDNGKVVRVVVCNRAALLEERSLWVVAFLGHRRTGLDFAMLNAVDDDLIHEFPVHPGVLSYSSFELDDGNYVNVVVLDGPGAQDHWRTSPRHAYAARELAPEFYACIRLQNGLMPRGLGDLESLRLVATKYYDFQREEPWLAVRGVEG